MKVDAPTVAVFFYGSYMNPTVLREADYAPGRMDVARLPGFDIRIAPRANLVRSPDSIVYGLLTAATHAELSRLYAHAKDVLGEVYLPEAVLVQTLDAAWRPALCYICHDMTPRTAEAAYVDRILAPARTHRFPEAYLKRLESFAPTRRNE
jgi:hypothetical protein